MSFNARIDEKYVQYYWRYCQLSWRLYCNADEFRFIFLFLIDSITLFFSVNALYVCVCVVFCLVFVCIAVTHFDVVESLIFRYVKIDNSATLPFYYTIILNEIVFIDQLKNDIFISHIFRSFSFFAFVFLFINFFYQKDNRQWSKKKKKKKCTSFLSIPFILYFVLFAFISHWKLHMKKNEALMYANSTKKKMEWKNDKKYIFCFFFSSGAIKSNLFQFRS